MRDEEVLSRLEISDEELAFWMDRIRPVVRFDVAGYDRPLKATKKNPVAIPFWIEPCDPRKVAFTWEPKPTKEARVRQLGHMITYHRFGAPSLFKPSIAEVIAQIIKDPSVADFKNEIIAFETGVGDLTSVNVWSGNTESCHWCATILYGDPEKMRDDR
jgi:hypothetical protein